MVFEVSKDVPRYIRADERKLRQVLINLLGNAIKFTNSGSVSLRVTVADPDLGIAQPTRGDREPAPASGCGLRFEVQDTGVGIAPDEMHRLFEAFVQTKSGQAVGEGTGLGLPISQQYVHLMGSEIHAESQEEKDRFSAL